MRQKRSKLQLAEKRRRGLKQSPLFMACTLGAFPALAFADDKKSSRKIKHKKTPGVHKLQQQEK